LANCLEFSIMRMLYLWNICQVTKACVC